jgi:hypothetical protein
MYLGAKKVVEKLEKRQLRHMSNVVVANHRFKAKMTMLNTPSFTYSVLKSKKRKKDIKIEDVEKARREMANWYMNGYKDLEDLYARERDNNTHYSPIINLEKRERFKNEFESTNIYALLEDELNKLEKETEIELCSVENFGKKLKSTPKVDLQKDHEYFEIFTATWLIILVLDSIIKIKINMYTVLNNLDLNSAQFHSPSTNKRNVEKSLASPQNTPLHTVNPNEINSLSEKVTEKRKIEEFSEEESPQVVHASKDKTNEKRKKTQTEKKSKNKKTTSQDKGDSSKKNMNFVNLPSRADKFVETNSLENMETNQGTTNNGCLTTSSAGPSLTTMAAMLSKSDSNTLGECAIFDEKDVVSHSNPPSRPKGVTREDLYRQRQEIIRPKTICFALSNSQMNFLSSTNIENFITSKTNVKLDRTGQSKGYSFIGQKLYVYTATQEDFENLITNKTWPLSKNQFVTLDHKSNTFVLRGICVDEIEQNKNIASDLENMGVKKWSPLIKGQTSHMGVKCECEEKAHLTEILKNFYVDGKKYSIGNGKHANVRFDPDIPKPNQCYKCFEYTDHIAINCPSSTPRCGNCGDKKHMDDDWSCQNQPNCVNCSFDPQNPTAHQHHAKDRKCKKFLLLREKKHQEKIFDLTQAYLKRPPTTKREQYAEMVRKHVEGNEVVNKFNQWINTQNVKVNNVERRYGEEMVKVEGEFMAIKEKASKYVDDMASVLELAKKAYNDLSDNIKKTTDERCGAMEKRFEAEVGRIDNNMNTLNRELGNWRTEVDKQRGDLGTRVGNIETFIGSLQQQLRTKNGANLLSN